MPAYRIYKLDGDNHINDLPKIVLHDSDAEAIEHAERLVDGHDIEIWDGPRLVIKLKSKDKMDSPNKVPS